MGILRVMPAIFPPLHSRVPGGDYAMHTWIKKLRTILGVMPRMIQALLVFVNDKSDREVSIQ